MSLTLNFLGGAPFQLLYDAVREAIGKTSKFKALLVNLETTLDCLQPRIVQQIRDRNVALNLPTEIIQDLQVKMSEGIELVAKLSRLSMWNIRVWGNCCNCIKPNYEDQLDELDRSLRRLLEILKLEQMSNVTELLDVARRTFDKLDQVQRGQSEILKALREIPGEIVKAQQEVIQRIEEYRGQHVANGGGAAPAPAPALGISFQMLFDAVTQAKVRNVICKRLLGEFRYTIDCLKPLIEEVAAYNKLLHLPKQDVEYYIIEMDKGVELVHKCSKARKWAFRKYNKTSKLLQLDESLQRLFIDLKEQLERNVKEAMDLTSNIEALIKKIGEIGVVDNDEIESEGCSLLLVPTPQSPRVGLDVLNMQGARDMIKETVIDVGVVETEALELVQGTTDVKEICELKYIEGAEVKRSEVSDVVQNQTQIAEAETEPPSATVWVDILDVKEIRDAVETLDSNVGVGEQSGVAPNQSEVALAEAEASSLTIGMSMQESRRDVETINFPRHTEVVKRKGKLEQEKEGNEDKFSVQSFEVDISEDMKEGLDDAGADPTNAFESEAGRFDAASDVPELSCQNLSTLTQETGDDIVRSVRLLREQGGDMILFSHSLKDITINKNNQVSSQKALSLPTLLDQYPSHMSERVRRKHESVDSTWKRVLDKKPLFPYQEWNIDYSELSIGTRIGIGFFGEVFEGIWNGTPVAIKVLLEQDLTAENMADFCNEISILSRIRHPNVLLFLGACMKPPHLSMVTEFMEMGSLYNLIRLTGKKFSERRKLILLRGICKGLMCIHRMKIVHGDIKSANCLVNKHWAVKICGFRLSTMMTETNSTDPASAGTPEWMAPEVIRKEPFTEKCDIFSFGVIMWELCTLSRPWEGVPPEKVVYAVANDGLRLEIPDNQLGKLISDCWKEQPHLRPTCEEILTRLVELQ